MKLSIQKRMLFLIAFLCVFIGQLFSQDQTTRGTDFWLSFGKNWARTTVAVNLQIKIATINATDVTITFTAGFGSDATVIQHIPAGGVYTLDLNDQQKGWVYSDIAGMTRKSMHITSTELISVYALNQYQATADATNILPTPSLGVDYYQISYQSDSIVDGVYSDGYTIVATVNNTEIYEDGNWLVTLAAGEVFSNYWVTDGTGKRITSNRPIAYFVTNQMVAIPVGLLSRDHLYQQLAPVNQWGTRFLVPNTVQEIGRVRIVASQNGTMIAQMGGSIISGNVFLNAGEFVELEIGSSGCYISSNNPVAVCAYMVTQSYVTALTTTYKGDPAMAWIPPIEQSLTDVLLAPFVPSKTTNLVDHYALIVTPTVDKDETTVSIGSGLANPISGVTWVDNVVSGYSFCSYQLLEDNSYLISNPSGLTVSGYGIGNIESYYYVSGSATRDLRAYYTINDIYYLEMESGEYCGNFHFHAFINYPMSSTPGHLRWFVNGVEQEDARDKVEWDRTFSVSTRTIEMRVTHLSGYVESYTTTFNVVTDMVVVWTPENNTGGSDADKRDWHNNLNWTPTVIPSLCTDVYIPGDCSHYPLLTQEAECNDIYFIQGGELGRPDLLKTYNQARVHLNLGLTATSQDSDTDLDLVLDSYDSADRLLFSAGRSTPLNRERWYMLSSPLRNVVSGDLGFGGFPLTYMQKFGPVTKDATNYLVGEWTDTYTSMKEPLSLTEGFAYFVYGYDSGSAANSLRNRGCLEFGNINDFAYFPERVGGYGLKEINGILELPFYEDQFQREAHRTQKYNAVEDKSTFYYIADGTYPNAMYHQIVDKKDEVLRESSTKGNYRFIVEQNTLGAWQFTNPVYHSGTGLGSSTEFMVGNPYMSSLDMIEFYKDNSTLLEPQFRIWDGTQFLSFEIDVLNNEILPSVFGESDYIAPMQAFFLVTKTDYANQNIKFDVTKISKVRPIGTPANLRSSNQEKNVIRIQSTNGNLSSHALIAGREKASHSYQKGEDIYKLFSPSTQLPQVYTLADEIPLDMNFINTKGEITIPIGLKTDYKGVISLTFSGMNNYFQASKIEFMDVVGNKVIDITDEYSFTYSFNNQQEGISNGQFFLRFSSSPTDIFDVLLDNTISVYRNQSVLSVSSGLLDPIQRIVIYDLQGKVLRDVDSLNTNFYTITTPIESSVLIVQVTTKAGSKTVKLNK